jgi:hypothetical protein
MAELQLTDGTKHNLGGFDTEYEAALAYNKFCAVFNQYSKLNII